MVGLFNRVGLTNNVRKTVRMVFRLCQAEWMQSEAAYGIRMMGVGPLYWERHQCRIQCTECGEEMELGLLVVHMQTQHGIKEKDICSWESTAPGETHTYMMAFPTAGVLRDYPIEGCPGRAATRTAVQVHFFHRHVRDNVIILEEGNIPHPR